MPACQTTADEFRAAMWALRVGETYKITAANRHPDCDSLLVEHVDLSAADIVDIGALDGSKSVDLIRQLPGLGHTPSQICTRPFPPPPPSATR